jgi:excisionase family DNA binding protein
MPSVMLCAKDVARALAISERSARRLMRRGEIAACKIGKLWRTETEHVAAYRAREYARYRRAL